MLASLTRKSLASRISSVGGNQVARREHREDVAGHERVGVHGTFDAVAHHATGEREALLQLLDRRGGAVLLVEAEQRGTDHDREDDPASTHWERLRDTAAATIKIRTRGRPTCLQSRRSGPRRSPTLFRPTTASRSAALAAVSPFGPEPSDVQTSLASRLQYGAVVSGTLTRLHCPVRQNRQVAFGACRVREAPSIPIESLDLMCALEQRPGCLPR